MSFFGLYLLAYISISFCMFYPLGYYANGGGINSYPFSTFSMYSRLLIKNEKGPLKVLGFGLDLKNSSAAQQVRQSEIINKVRRDFASYYRLKDSSNVKDALIHLNKHLQTKYTLHTDSLVLKRILYEFITFPKSAGIIKYFETDIGILYGSKFIYAYPVIKITKDSVKVEPVLAGFTKPEVHLIVYNDFQRRLIEVKKGTFCFLKSDPVFQGNKLIFILSVYDDAKHYLFSGGEENI